MWHVLGDAHRGIARDALRSEPVPRAPQVRRPDRLPASPTAQRRGTTLSA